jgi:SAM-dependent methyltransferase
MHRAILDDVGAETIRFDACTRCGLQTATPMRSWSTDNYPRAEYGLAFDHAESLRDLETRPPLAVLELGCADGAFLAAAKRLGHHPLGLDFVPESVAAARGRGVEAHAGDVAALAQLAPGRRYDAVAMFQIIEHLVDPNAVFADISRVAGPGSRLYVGCPSDRRYSRHHRHAATVGDSDYWDWPPAHTMRWTDAAFHAFLPRHGWNVARIVHEPFSLVGAAAHLTAIDGHGSGWYANPVRRRVRTAMRMAGLAARNARTRLAGLRMLVVAERA